MHALLWMLAACDAEPPAPTITPPPAAAAPAPEAAAPAAAVPMLDPDAPLPERITARHILISYAGSAAEGATRSREEAAQLADQLRQRLAADPGAFPQLAVERSDDPQSGAMGGHLGSFGQGTMVPAFDAVAFRLPVGGISAVFETPFGFHIVERLPSEEIRVAHVLVQWKGVKRATEATRTQEEARAVAEEALRRVQSGEPIAAVAAALSDGPNAARGGDLGTFTRGQLVPAFEEVAFALEVGAVSGIVESPMGYHVISRLE